MAEVNAFVSVPALLNIPPELLIGLPQLVEIVTVPETPLLNCTPDVPFKLMSKLPPMLKDPLLFSIALVPILPELPLVIVTAPELVHTALVPSVNPPDGTETLAVVVREPSNVPPVHVRLLVIVPPAIFNVPPANASVPAPLIEPPFSMAPPDRVKLVPVATLIDPEFVVAPEIVIELALTLTVPVLLRLANV